MDSFIYAPPGQEIRMEIREAEYQKKDALRLDIRVQEPLVTYSAIARIEHGRLFIKGKPFTPPWGDLKHALWAHGVQFTY